MKAKIIFNFPDDNLEYERCNDAPKLSSVIWDLDQELRKREKHEGNEPITPGEVRELLRDLMNDSGIDFDKLYFQ